MHPLLSIQDLSVEFRSETGLTSAVRNISFQVQPGEILAIVGESGSGKSVTALSILKLIPAADYPSGKILFSKNGEEPINLLKLNEKELRTIRGNEISMIFQEPMTSLNPVYTCGEQVREAIILHEKISLKKATEKVYELFEQVKLPDPKSIYKRFPHQLSGGQKQRVMIAMAMSCNPSLLICDEPTTALDATVQKTILELIKELQSKTGMAVIFITHDLGLVGELADRAIVMLKGAIVESGATRKIFTHPEHPYTKALLACRPGLHKKGDHLPTVEDFLGKWNVETSGVELVPNVPKPSESRSKGMTRESLMEVRNLSVLFPGKKNLLGRTISHIKAVDNISFEVYQGETLGLVGESGSGKTTLGRTLLRLIQPSEGAVIYKGTDLAKLFEHDLRKLRKDLQIIFQDPYSSLNPRITVGKAIAEPLKTHQIISTENERRERVYELLYKVNLEEQHYNRYPHEFSGGQRQRIVIARALSLDPSFIICDESVSALDVSVQAQVLNLFTQLKEELGFTVIFISHDLSVVHYLSDRIMVLNKGRIEEIGEADQVYHNPQSQYTRRLLDAVPKGLPV